MIDSDDIPVLAAWAEDEARRCGSTNIPTPPTPAAELPDLDARWCHYCEAVPERIVIAGTICCARCTRPFDP